MAGFHLPTPGRFCLPGDILSHAVAFHSKIADGLHITLKDDTASYQAAWKNAINKLLSNYSDNYDYLEMV